MNGSFEATLQRLQRTPHPRLHGAQRLAHRFRDFCVTQAVKKRQRHTLALLGVQPLHALRQRTCIRGLAQQVERVGRGVGHGVVHVGILVVVGNIGNVGLKPGLCLCTAQTVDGAVSRNAGQPGEGLTLSGIKILRRAPDVDKNLLENVFGLCPVTIDTQHNTQQMRAGSLIKCGKSHTIT